MTTWDRLDRLWDKYEGGVRLDYGSDYAWSCELRLLTLPQEDAADRSVVFYTVGGPTPEWVLDRALDDVERWTQEQGGA